MPRRLALLAHLTLALAAFSLAQVQAAVPAQYAQAGVVTGVEPAQGAARSKAHAGSVKVAAAPAAKSESSPTWQELNTSQKQALGPLSGTWSTLSEAHKRKWIALSQNYPKMPPAEQARLHGRMSEWAALTPQQRTQARLNFAETQKLSTQDKKAMWEAYQALPAEEKKKLAAGATAVKPPPPHTAAAVKPVPQQKLAEVPAKQAKKPNARTPRIAAAPNQVDHNTLLPQPGAAPGPAGGAAPQH
jgi:hypothetical protein